jgi:hypothetical protein
MFQAEGLEFLAGGRVFHQGFLDQRGSADEVIDG